MRDKNRAKPTKSGSSIYSRPSFPYLLLSVCVRRLLATIITVSEWGRHELGTHSPKVNFLLLLLLACITIERIIIKSPVKEAERPVKGMNPQPIVSESPLVFSGLSAPPSEGHHRTDIHTRQHQTTKAHQKEDPSTQGLQCK